MYADEPKNFLLETALPLLDQLPADAQPKWGIMTPQHMIEHLGGIFYISRKEVGLKQATAEEHLPRTLAWLWSDKPFRQNTKAPGIAQDELTPLKYADLDEARLKLTQAVAGFFAAYEAEPNKTVLHPVFGQLTYEAWLRFHHKHLVHHLMQFNLL
jgi:oxepin-CoA hydrolase/3-oxo-5,6-dehydrosuberyl-CoA semialdehyde dehydrogenase